MGTHYMMFIYVQKHISFRLTLLNEVVEEYNKPELNIGRLYCASLQRMK